MLCVVCCKGASGNLNIHTGGSTTPVAITFPKLRWNSAFISVSGAITAFTVERPDSPNSFGGSITGNISISIGSVLAMPLTSPLTVTGGSVATLSGNLAGSATALQLVNVRCVAGFLYGGAGTTLSMTGQVALDGVAANSISAAITVAAGATLTIRSYAIPLSLASLSWSTATVNVVSTTVPIVLGVVSMTALASKLNTETDIYALSGSGLVGTIVTTSPNVKLSLMGSIPSSTLNITSAIGTAELSGNLGSNSNRDLILQNVDLKTGFTVAATDIRLYASVATRIDSGVSLTAGSVTVSSGNVVITGSGTCRIPNLSWGAATLTTATNLTLTATAMTSTSLLTVTGGTGTTITLGGTSVRGTVNVMPGVQRVSVILTSPGISNDFTINSLSGLYVAS